MNKGESIYINPKTEKINKAFNTAAKWILVIIGSYICGYFHCFMALKGGF